MNQETIWVMSRKISIKSMTRHFAAWKLRQFVLDKKNALLGTRVKTALKLTVIPLSAQTVSVRHHYYSNDQKFCLSLRYSDVTVEAGEHEIVMKFENLEKMNKWLKALSEVLTESKKAFSRRSSHYLKTFNEYVIQQCQMQAALGHRHAICDGHVETSLPPTSARSSQYHSRAMIRSNDECKFWQIPVPKLRILIMAVGTRGDMQPFVMLGLRLQGDGHRVRVATHEPFRDYVIGKGLEFYPLAGDPVKLSEFMVKTHGFIIPTSADAFKEVPLHHAMMVEIMHSCWDACIKVDPQDPQERPFIADAIISNPVTYAHIHCAEALGVPLHLMFPQPWVPTKAFPHPLSCLSYQQGWCTENFISYQVIDSMLWMSFESNINAFRKNVLGLEPVRVGEGGWNMLNRLRVPFVKMWSPTLVPKPKDWPDYVDVVGTFFDTESKTSQHGNSSSNNIAALNQTKTTVTTHKNRTEATLESEEYSPSPELVTFLKSDVPIIFIGFGSMVIQNIEEIISLFLEAAALANVRVLIQMGWSSISPERFLSMAKEAQQKAKTVRDMELMNDDSQDALIFPPGPPPDAEDDGFQLHMGLDSPPRVHKKNSVSKSGSDDKTIVKTRLAHKESDPDLEKTANQSTNSGGSGSGGAERRPSNTVAPPLVPPPFKSAPSNSMTGLFYTALQTFVIAKKSPPSSEAHSVSASTHSKQSPTPDHAGSVGAAEVLSETSPLWSASSDAFFIGPCPHSWLFKHVDAVVHHGGAGTTAAGLRQGCPTWICPFFGDQFFWGELVHRGGLGPRPVPIDSLTLDIVAESLTVLRSESMRQAAREISKVLKTEDGVEGAMNAFYRHLPIENMVCDVSMFKGESRLAQVYCKECGMKLCSEVSDIIHAAGGPKASHHLVPCSYMNWTVPPPTSAASGIVQGLGGLMHELAEGVSDAVYDPVMGVYAEGLNGGVSGVVSGFHSLAKRPFRGGGLLLNRVAIGLKNSLGIIDGDSPVRSPTEGESVAGMVYGRDHSSTQNRQIRSMRISGDRANASEKTQLKEILAAGQNVSGDDRIILAAEPQDPLVKDENTTNSRPSEMRQIREAIAHEISRVLSDSGMKNHTRGTKRDAAEVEAAAQESAFVIRRESIQDEEQSDSSRANSTDNNGAGVFTFNAETQDEEAGGELMLSVILENSAHSGGGSVADSIIISSNELSPPIVEPQEEVYAQDATPVGGLDNSTGSINDEAVESPDSPDLPNVSKLTVDAVSVPVVSNEELVESVWLSYQKAVGAQQMFRLLGASNGRFMTMDNFTKMLYRALIRKYADNTEGDSPSEGENGMTVNMHDSIIFRVGDPRGEAGSLNMDTVTALVRLLARNKRYLDLVDFFLLYQEIIQGGQKWKEMPHKIISTSL